MFATRVAIESTNKDSFNADVCTYLAVNEIFGSVLHDRSAVYIIKLSYELSQLDELTQPGQVSLTWINMNQHEYPL